MKSFLNEYCFEECGGLFACTCKTVGSFRGADMCGHGGLRTTALMQTELVANVGLRDFVEPSGKPILEDGDVGGLGALGL